MYGHKCLDGWKFMPENAELYWYTEGYRIPDTVRVRQIDNSSLPALQEFKARYANYVAPYYTMDVVRFANKVFAVHDALYDHDGLGVWMDADIVPFAKMPDGYVEDQLPDGKYIAMYKRAGMYSECGWWVVDCRHPGHKTFMDAFLAMYTTDEFRNASEWHDSFLMDIVVRNLERNGVISSHDLSGPAGKTEHPMSVADIRKYVDHLKGPHRKEIGWSPENAYRGPYGK